MANSEKKRIGGAMTEYPRQTTRYCKRCGHKLRIYREEYEMLCDGCMTAWPMPRAAFNDIKAAALRFVGTEDEFVLTWMDDSYVRDMARRAYRAAKVNA